MSFIDLLEKVGLYFLEYVSKYKLKKTKETKEKLDAAFKKAKETGDFKPVAELFRRK